MELELRRYLSSKSTPELSGMKQKLQKKISESDDVQFYWAIVSAEWEEGESQALLGMIVEHWITVRGFSFTSGWLERYKQANKKLIQKTKGVRKQLLPTSRTLNTPKA